MKSTILVSACLVGVCCLLLTGCTNTPPQPSASPAVSSAPPVVIAPPEPTRTTAPSEPAPTDGSPTPSAFATADTTEAAALALVLNWPKDPYGSLSAKGKTAYASPAAATEAIPPGTHIRYDRSTWAVEDFDGKRTATLTANVTYPNGVSNDYEFGLVVENGMWKIDYTILAF